MCGESQFNIFLASFFKYYPKMVFEPDVSSSHFHSHEKGNSSSLPYEPKLMLLISSKFLLVGLQLWANMLSKKKKKKLWANKVKAKRNSFFLFLLLLLLLLTYFREFICL